MANDNNLLERCESWARLKSKRSLWLPIYVVYDGWNDEHFVAEESYGNGDWSGFNNVSKYVDGVLQ